MIPKMAIAHAAIGSHERPGQGATNDWLTPRWLLDALGPFDLDPCASESNPLHASLGFAQHFTAYTWREDGLSKPWSGFVWCNPPYGPHAGKWLTRLAEHGNGIALVFARTETKTFNPALLRADATLFIAGRLVFETPNQTRAKGNAGAPSMLLAFGQEAEKRLRRSQIPGALMAPFRRVF